MRRQKRSIEEFLDNLDKMDAISVSSTTTKPITVYRDAPRDWLNTLKDSILIDRGFFSTSTEHGASMEGLICNGKSNFTYEIKLPAGTKFWDLTNTNEKEMLLPRNSMFKDLGGGLLEYIGQASL